MESSAAYLLVRHEGQFFIAANAGTNSSAFFPIVSELLIASLSKTIPLGHHEGLPCLAIELKHLPSPPTGSLTAIREIFTKAGKRAFELAGRASELLDWDKNHQFCGQCGTPTRQRSYETAKECPNCGLVAYPRISPAIMVLIRKGNQLLLARSPRFRQGVYSAIAGFVEAGETLEECAHREVMEEVGLKIKNLRYFQSQPWPFPDSLMIAFFADFDGGTIKPDASEIEDAQWFSLTTLPELPDPVSIARRLIDAAIGELENQIDD